MEQEYIDLHFHSYYSGGVFSPKEVIKLARRFNIKVMALADHNTVAGVKEFLIAAGEAKIIGISAVELYTAWRQKKLHLLGYFIDTENSWLKASLEELCSKRRRKIEESLFHLEKTGFTFNMDNLWNTKSHYLDFGQIIKWLQKDPKNAAKIKKDLKTDDPNFFAIINHYFKKPAKTRLEETSLPARRAINIIKQAGGMAVLAHPGQQLSWNQDYIIQELKELGISGLEIISPYHNWHQVEHYQRLAKKLKLKVTGGSDFHTPLADKSRHAITLQWQWQRVPISFYHNLVN